MPFRNFSAFTKSLASSTPAFAAAWYASSLNTSQPPNTMSSSFASCTKSLIFGVRPSVRLPSRIVPNCVSEPTGTAWPRRTNSTPAIKVVLTAPIPGVSTPSFPFGGVTLTGLRIRFPPVRFVFDDDDEDDESESREKDRASCRCMTPSLPRAHGASRNLHFLSCAADESFRSVSAPRRKKRSEQTIYHAATRAVLQIDFPTRGKRQRLEKCG